MRLRATRNAAKPARTPMIMRSGRYGFVTSMKKYPGGKGTKFGLNAYLQHGRHRIDR
jgi:hypothetical protein